MRYIRQIFNFKFYQLLYYFVAYSFIGWCLETTYMSFSEGHFINRGFLLGPFCPIYGFGALALIIFLTPMRGNWALFFTASVALTSIVEYLTSYIFEVALGKRLWDYSNLPLNIHGRICLVFSLLWGVLAITLLNIFHPRIEQLVSHIPGHHRTAISSVLMFYFIADLTVSLSFTTGVTTTIQTQYLDTGDHKPAIEQSEIVDVMDEANTTKEIEVKRPNLLYKIWINAKTFKQNLFDSIKAKKEPVPAGVY